MISEVTVGLGDYALGGDSCQPFLSLDGARRRRPLVLGEVSRDPPALLAEMFSGRAGDPRGWAEMWMEVGADGVCLRLEGVPADEALRLVEDVSERTRLPVAVSADPGALPLLASVSSTSLMLLNEDGPAPGHATLADFALFEGSFPDPSGFRAARDDRMRALAKGDGRPIVFDATPVWGRGFADARSASMAEGEAALAAMLCGADAVIVKGPGAADMARVYGEELADL